MNPKFFCKIVVDTAMTVLLLLLMGRQFLGDCAHEWIGVSMFVLFLVHHVLNFGSYRGLTRGKFNASRLVQTIVGILLLIDMLGLMISGIMISRYVFAFLPTHGGMAFARILHLLCVYWGFVLMSLHIGLHWDMILKSIRRAVNFPDHSRIRKVLLPTMAILIATFGVYAFFTKQIGSYLLLKNQFVFMDPVESPFLFYADYLAVMGLFVFLAHYVAKLMKKHHRPENK